MKKQLSGIAVIFFCSLQSLVLLAAKEAGQAAGINRQAWEVMFVNPDSAIVMLKQNMLLAERENDLLAKGEATAKLGVAYDLKGDSKSALKYFLAAIDLQKSVHDEKGLSFTYNNLGLMFYGQYNYPDALKYLQQSVVIDRKLNDRRGMAGTMVNIGIIYSYFPDSLDRSLDIYQQAYKIYVSLEDTSGIESVLVNEAKIYYQRKEYDEALELYLQAEQLPGLYLQPERMISLDISLANCYLKMGRIQQAEQTASRALTLASGSGLRERLQYVFDILQLIEVEKADYKKAYYFLKRYTDLRDSLLNEDLNAALAEMKVKYETEKIDRERVAFQLEKEQEKLLREETEKKNLQISYQRNWLISIVLIVVLGLSVLLIAYRNKQNLNKVLAEKNKLTEENLKQKELLIGEVHHRIKNNLQLISGMLDMQSRFITSEEGKAALINSISRMNSVAQLHEYLYNQNDIYGVNMREYIEKLGKGISESVSGNFNIVTKVDSVTLDVNTSIPVGLIVNESVTNSLKHANPGDEKLNIEIRLHLNSNDLLLEISDNGIAGDEEEEKKNYGSRLLQTLSRQLGATWSTDTGKGFVQRFVITRFKLIKEDVA